jgi:hypothetical protein
MGSCRTQFRCAADRSGSRWLLSRPHPTGALEQSCSSADRPAQRIR